MRPIVMSLNMIEVGCGTKCGFVPVQLSQPSALSNNIKKSSLKYDEYIAYE